MFDTEKLKSRLLKIPHVVEIEWGTSPIPDELNQIIFLTKYDIPIDMENYWEERKQLRLNVLKVCCEEFNMYKTEDTIEDYGEHFYWVFGLKGGK